MENFAQRLIKESASTAKEKANVEEGLGDIKASTPNEELCKFFLHRENILVFIRQLNQLVKCAQRYRGLSLGMVSGHRSFHEGFSQIQIELEKRLLTIQAFAKNMNGLLSPKEEENLNLAWNTVRHDWQNDGLEDNFELHTHFVEQVLAMIINMANELKLPLWESHDIQEDKDKRAKMGEAANETYSSPRLFKQIEVLDFVTKNLLSLIECIAKIRGLSSYAAAVGAASSASDQRACARISLT